MRKVVKFDRTRRKSHWHLADPPKRRRWRLRLPARLLRRALLLGVLLVVLLVSLGDAAMGTLKGHGPCRVVKIIDGDTVALWCLGSGSTRARLIGFDTPEIFSPQCFSERLLGLRATFALRGELWAARRIGVRTSGLDRYGRRLTLLTVDGVPVGERLIDRGLARAYSGGLRSSWC